MSAANQTVGMGENETAQVEAGTVETLGTDNPNPFNMPGGLPFDLPENFPGENVIDRNEVIELLNAKLTPNETLTAEDVTRYAIYKAMATKALSEPSHITAQRAGISRATYFRYMKAEGFKAGYNAFITENFADHDAEMLQRIVDIARSDSPKSIDAVKQYFSMRGFRPGIDINVSGGVGVTVSKEDAIDLEMLPVICKRLMLVCLQGGELSAAMVKSLGKELTQLELAIEQRNSTAGPDASIAPIKLLAANTETPISANSPLNANMADIGSEQNNQIAGNASLSPTIPEPRIVNPQNSALTLLESIGCDTETLIPPSGMGDIAETVIGNSLLLDSEGIELICYLNDDENGVEWEVE